MLITETLTGVRIDLAADEIEPFKDLVTSFLEHYPNDCGELVSIAEDHSRAELLESHARAIADTDGSRDPELDLEESEIRDALCWQLMEKVGTEIIEILGEGGTSYALNDLYNGTV